MPRRQGAPWEGAGPGDGNPRRQSTMSLREMMSCFCLSRRGVVKEEFIEQENMPVIIPMVVQHSAVEENESEPSTPVVLEAPAPPPTPPTPHLDGLSLRYLSQLSKSLPSGRDWSLRQIVERLVLPATAARKCAFVETLQGSDAIGEATYFVAMDWETPFASTIESLLNHVNQMDAYVLISVLAFSLWSEVAFHTTTLSDFDHRKSSSSSFGSSRNGITAAPLMLDADQFVSHITHTLVNSERRQSLTLLLCLDELLVSLGRILPMHAAWAAMRVRQTSLSSKWILD